ncbi:MAG: hypothetical protein CVV27_11070 [Candidatus Melainabacteria bacterium HGW-Melainabacteria-1]|nr:MAG: hypothetical protein CVV27_11070 [Candidatus Melainabacteria bacterium HGW-Melainabacteria-1]
MKQIITSGLALISLAVSLSACGGNATSTSPMAPGFNPAAQPQALSAPPVSTYAGQDPYLQPNYAYQAPVQNTRAPLPAGSRPTPAFQSFQGSPTKPTARSAGAPVRQATASAPRPQAPVAARPPAATSESIGRELIAKTRAKFEQLQSFVVTGNAIEKNEKGETRIKLKLVFQKPGSVRLDIVQHNNSMYNGTKLTYLAGGDKVTGRPGGALSFMKMTVPMSDERILTRRGYRLDQVDTNAIVTRLLGNPNLNPKILGKTMINGHEIAVLEFLKVNDFDQRITRELLGIDMKEHFVRIHEMYEGSNLVYSLKLEDVQLNGQVSAADFNV